MGTTIGGNHTHGYFKFIAHWLTGKLFTIGQFLGGDNTEEG